MSKKIDYLTEDDELVNQHYVCLSFLSPEGITNCSLRGLKVRGVYDTREEAEARAKFLQKADPDFHVFVGEVGKWLPWDPNPNTAKDQVYGEEELQNLMKGYKENQEKAKEMEQKRKSGLLKKAVDEERARKAKERAQKKLAEKRALKENKQEPEPEPVQEPEPEQEPDTDELPVDLQQQKEELDKLNKVVGSKETELRTMSEKQEKIKQLYSKLKK